MRVLLGGMVLVALLAVGCGGGSSSSTDADKAVAAAHRAYATARARGVELADGPCIAESLPGLGDWVVDVAHDPRRAVDDDPANQCERFRAGEAHHFVELTPGGDLIRAQ